MFHAKVNFKKIYTIIAVKTPILVLTIVSITATLLYYFSVTSTLGVFKKYAAEIKVDGSGKKHLETWVNDEYFGRLNLNSRVFWYTNKEETVYNAIVSKVDKHDGKLKLTIIPADQNKEILAKANKVYIDIEIGKKTLLDRLFKKGVNNE